MILNLQQEFVPTVPTDPHRRDALRRLLVHICQQADVLPLFIILTSDDVVLPTDDDGHTELLGARPSGEGSYGTIYKVQLNVRNAVRRLPVAIKCLKFLTGQNEEERMRRKQVRHYLQERQLLINYSLANVPGDRSHLDSEAC